jgi:phage shock protein PspC (stress-responsive transcriptional regulator)
MTSAPPPAPPVDPPPVDPPPVDPPPAWQPPPPPSGPPARTQLRRSRTDKVVGGVSGGLAEYSGIDPLLWRVGFVALAFAGGTGVIVYLLLWLLMPAGPPGGAPDATGGSAARVAKPPAGPRSPVPGITVSALLIVVGLLALISRFTPADFGPRVYFGAALLVVGLGLVAAAFIGGRTARGGLIALGVVLSLALIAASAEPWRGVDGDVGDRVYIPASAAEVRSEYHGSLGDMRLDLSSVDVSGLNQSIETRVDAGIGAVTILVPRDADVRVNIDSGIGSVDVFGEGGRSDGYFAGSGSGSWVGDDEAEIVLTVNAGIGDVEVSRG